MADKRAGSCRDGQWVFGHPTGNKYGQHAFQNIARQGQSGSDFIAKAKHVGGTGFPEPSERGSGSCIARDTRIALETEPSKYPAIAKIRYSMRGAGGWVSRG